MSKTSSLENQERKNNNKKNNNTSSFYNFNKLKRIKGWQFFQHNAYLIVFLCLFMGSSQEMKKEL
jgi:hypothetical protein